MRIDKGNEPRRRSCMCVKCYNYIQPDEKRIVEKQGYYHVICYVKELNRHLKWFDKVEKSGIRWKAEKAKLMKKFGAELMADAL